MYSALDLISSVTATVEPEGIDNLYLKATRFIENLARTLSNTVLPSTKHFKFVEDYKNTVRTTRPLITYSVETVAAFAEEFAKSTHIFLGSNRCCSTITVIAEIKQNTINIFIQKSITGEGEHLVEEFIFDGTKSLTLIAASVRKAMLQSMAQMLKMLERLYKDYDAFYSSFPLIKAALTVPQLSTRTVFNTDYKKRAGGERFIEARVYLPATGREYIFEAAAVMHTYGIDDGIIPKPLFSITVRTEIPSPIDNAKNIRSVSIINIAQGTTSAAIANSVESKYHDFAYELESRLP